MLDGAADAYGDEAVVNPNVLEFNGNRFLKSGLASSSPTPSSRNTPKYGGQGLSAQPIAIGLNCACVGRAVVSSIAVNRVQTTYATPVHDAEGGDVVALDRTLWALSAAADGKQISDGGRHGVLLGGFDECHYRSQSFASVHTGDLAFANTDGQDKDEVRKQRFGHPQNRGGNEDGRTVPLVTVLLPVKDGGRYLEDAVNSVQSCAQRMPGGVELLIVDDGSSDGAVETTLAAMGVAAEQSHDPGQRARSVDGNTINGVSTRVIRHESSVGVAASLNEGLLEARSELVARLDADDICLCERLERQVSVEHLSLTTAHGAISGCTYVCSVERKQPYDARAGE